jgi:hypothetical protein
MKISTAIISSLLAVSASAFDKYQRKSNLILTTRLKTHKPTP